MTRNVALFVFPDAEVLDFAGPFEVFALAGNRHPELPLRPHLVAETLDLVIARNGFKVVPDYTLETCPAIEVLVIPGGKGTRPLLERPAVIEWIRARSAAADIVLSVCSGSLLLAKAGLLEGLKATTHHAALDELRALAPRTTIDPSVRFHDNGKIITTGGISAGIDGALHVLTRLGGAAVARDVADHMEYFGSAPSTSSP
jgi:transcriptional regulator GlxA family with amidase domain